MALRNLNPFKDNSAEGSGFGGKTDLLLLLQNWTIILDIYREKEFIQTPFR